MSGSISFNSAEFYVVEQSINNEEYAQVIIDSVQGTVLINLNHTNSVLFWCNYIVWQLIEMQLPTVSEGTIYIHDWIVYPSKYIHVTSQQLGDVIKRPIRLIFHCRMPWERPLCFIKKRAAVYKHLQSWPYTHHYCFSLWSGCIRFTVCTNALKLTMGCTDKYRTT